MYDAVANGSKVFNPLTSLLFASVKIRRMETALRGQCVVDFGFDDVYRRAVRYEPQFVDVGLAGSAQD